MLALGAATPPRTETDAVRAWVDEWWQVAIDMGCTESSDGLPLDPERIHPADDQWLALLAGRSNPNNQSSAVVFRAHDVVGVLVRLDAEAVGASFDRLRTPNATGRPASVFGGARLLVMSAERPADFDSEAALSAFGIQEPGLQLRALTDDGVLITEVESPSWRTFVVVIPKANCHLVDGLVGIVPGPDLGSLLRYIVHAAKLRYLVGVFQAELPGLRVRAERSDQSLRELFRLHESLEGERGRLNRSLFDAYSRLSRAHNEAAGLAVMTSRLNDLARSSRTALRNMHAHAPIVTRAVGPGESTSFERDAELARWLDNAIDQEYGYLTATRERAHEAQELTRLRLEQANEEQAHLGNWLTVLQTSVLAAVLGCLGVVEAFQIQVADDLRWPALITVPLLSLVLPPLALRWVTGVGTLDIVAAAACGAAVGWTAAVAANVPSAAVAATIGASTVLGAASLYVHRKSQGAG